MDHAAIRNANIMIAARYARWRRVCAGIATSRLGTSPPFTTSRIKVNGYWYTRRASKMIWAGDDF